MSMLIKTFSPMFMTWRVPRGASKNGGKEISDADLDRAIRNQFQSTYGKRLVPSTNQSPG